MPRLHNNRHHGTTPRQGRGLPAAAPLLPEELARFLQAGMRPSALGSPAWGASACVRDTGDARVRCLALARGLAFASPDEKRGLTLGVPTMAVVARASGDSAGVRARARAIAARELGFAHPLAPSAPVRSAWGGSNGVRGGALAIAVHELGFAHSAGVPPSAVVPRAWGDSAGGLGGARARGLAIVAHGLSFSTHPAPPSSLLVRAWGDSISVSGRGRAHPHPRSSGGADRATLSPALPRQTFWACPDRRLARPVQVKSDDAMEGVSKADDDNRLLYTIISVCLVAKSYPGIKEKVLPVLLTKFPVIACIMGESVKRFSSLITLLALIKAIYESLKLAKEINELIKYYRKRKTTQVKAVSESKE